MKKKLMYQKPAMQLIELPCRQQLLTVSQRRYIPDDDNPFDTTP